MALVSPLGLFAAPDYLARMGDTLDLGGIAPPSRDFVFDSQHWPRASTAAAKAFIKVMLFN